MCECKFWASEFRGPCRPWSRSYRCYDHLMLVLEIEPKSCASPYWLFTIEPTGPLSYPILIWVALLRNPTSPLPKVQGISQAHGKLLK